MASAWSKGLFDETLGSDPNGNQLNWNNQINPPPQPGFNSLGSYQQPGQSFQMPQWGPWGAVANNISGSKSYGFAPQPQPTPGRAWMGPTQPQKNSFGSFNPQAPNGSWAQQSKPYVPAPIVKTGGISDFKRANNESQRSGMPYAQKFTPQQIQGQGYAQMRKDATAPNPKNGAFFQAAKNPLVLQAQAAAQKSFWSNAYTQLNAALRGVDLSGTPKASGGGGYGYGDWGYGYGGGGGYTQRKYAENLPGAVWRMNQ
jgi:hypothetical protein